MTVVVGVLSFGAVVFGALTLGTLTFGVLDGGLGSLGATGTVVEGRVGATGAVVGGETPSAGPVGPAGSVSATACEPQTQIAITNVVIAAHKRIGLRCDITLQPPCCCEKQAPGGSFPLLISCIAPIANIEPPSNRSTVDRPTR